MSDQSPTTTLQCRSGPSLTGPLWLLKHPVRLVSQIVQLRLNGVDEALDLIDRGAIRSDEHLTLGTMGSFPEHNPQLRGAALIAEDHVQLKASGAVHSALLSL